MAAALTSVVSSGWTNAGDIVNAFQPILALVIGLNVLVALVLFVSRLVRG